VPGEVWVVLVYEPDEVEKAKADGTLHEFSGIHGVSVHAGGFAGEQAAAEARDLQARMPELRYCASRMIGREEVEAIDD
jgi:hypothetical protein